LNLNNLFKFFAVDEIGCTSKFLCIIYRMTGLKMVHNHENSDWDERE